MQAGFHCSWPSGPWFSFPLLLVSLSSLSFYFFWVLGSNGHAHGVKYSSHSNFVSHAASNTEGVNITLHHAAMYAVSRGPQFQASNSHTVPTITPQLLTLPCICGVMPLTLEPDSHC